MVSEQVAVLPPLLSTGLPQLELEVPGGGLTEVVIAWLGAPGPAGLALTTIVKVCGVPTSFTPLGEIEMLASTYCLTAGPLSPLRPSPVARVTATPPIFFFNDAAAAEVYALSLLDALPILAVLPPLLSTGLPQFVASVPGVGLTEAV